MEFKQHNKIYLNLAQIIHDALYKVNSEAQLHVEEVYNLLAAPPKKGVGEVSFPCFILAKKLKKAPAQLAQDIQAELPKHELISSTKNVGPYLNFFLNPAIFNEVTIKSINSSELFCQELTQKAPRTIVEFSQPNTHKLMHIGHMRNLCLGATLVNLYRYGGIPTHATTFPGDVGTHVAKCLWYYKKHHHGDTPPEHKGAWLGQMYVAGTTLLSEQKDEAQAAQNKAELTQILKELHAGHGEYYELWKETRQWSLELMQEVYAWAGVTFDSWYWESDVDADSVHLVKKYYEQGLFIKDDGAIGIDLSDDKLGFCLLLKSDGTGLYATKDLELARRKFELQNIQKSLYVVDNRQTLHFKQVFKALEKMGFENAKNCVHLPYEMVELPDGAMSSRKGNTIPIQTLIEQMHEKIITDFLEKYRGEWSDEEIEHTAHIIGAGAIKYGMTRIDSHKKIIFNLQEWLKLDGESGPYIQYVHARIKSMLTKVGDYGQVSFELLTHELEKELINKMSQFNSVIENCIKQNKTHTLCSYLYELSKNFNSFYAECSLLKAESEQLMYARAELAKAVANTLKEGLGLLGITAPDKM